MPRVKSEFPAVTLELDVYGVAVTFDLGEWADNLLVDPNDIPAQLERQGTLYFDIAQYAACAVSYAERQKQKFEIWQAEKWRELFDAAVESGDKPPTVDGNKAAVKSHPKYRDLLDRWMDAQEDASLLVNARDAMKMRQFMLSQLAGALRAEGE